jgi:ABC-type dipeptide/oligopeptide/nickel transport system permease subunit
MVAPFQVRSRRQLVTLGIAVVSAAGATAWLFALGADARIYARGLLSVASFAALLTILSCLVAIPLGLLAAGGPRAFDAALRFACDLIGVLPTLFVVAVLWASTDTPTTLLCALGVMRGLELGWLLRCELLRIASDTDGDGPRSFTLAPLSILFRRRLPEALGPMFASASFSVAWLCGLDAAVTLAGLRPARAHPSWGLALGGAGNPGVGLLAAASVVLLTLALSALLLALGRALNFGSGVRGDRAP